MTRFHRNQWLKCVDAGAPEDGLTDSYHYRVLDTQGANVLVLDDSMREVWAHDSRFVACYADAHVTENENIYAFDIDDTLVHRDAKELEMDLERLVVRNPYSNTVLFLRPYTAHIELLKEMHGRGRHILVWSAGGVRWAQAVIKALKLEQYVHEYKTKPIGYVDDKPANEWLQNRIYLEEKA
jgi:hypothetical protein